LAWTTHSQAQNHTVAVKTEKRQIVAVFPERFPPIFSLTVNNMPTGFGIDVIDAVASIAGLKIKYVPVATWEEAGKWLREGRADIIPNYGITENRKNFAAFTRPINKVPVSLLVFNDDIPFANLSELRNTSYIVGAIETNVGASLLVSDKSIKSKLFPHLADALIAMENKQVDAIIYPAPNAIRLSVQLRLKDDLKVLGDPVVEIPRAIAVNKQDPILLQDLDTALATYLTTKSYAKVYHRWYPRPVFWEDKRLIYLVGGFLASGFLGFIYFRFNVMRQLNRELLKSNTFIRTVLNITAEGILTLDKNGVIYSINKSAEKIFGRSKESLINHSIQEFMPEFEAQTFIKSLAKNALTHAALGDAHSEDYFREYRFKSKDGKLFPIRIALESTKIEGAQYFVCTLEDVRQLREAQSLADFYTSHDPQTGLINQNGFNILLTNLLSQAKRRNESLSCLHIDIERMHVINNTYGYDIGDNLLIAFTRRLENIINRSNLFVAYSNTLARIDGNRFIIVLPNMDAARASAEAKNLLRDIEKQSFKISNYTINISCKIGIATFPEHGSGPMELLSHSEAALRVAKTDPMTPYHLYVEAEDKVEKLTNAWAEKIITGLRDNRFFLLFQPILEIKTGKINHFEALVRYQDDDGGIVLPNEFIPVAERYGSIKRLDRRIMQLAISHLAGLETATDDLAIAVNLSGANIGDSELFEWLEALLEENALDPNHLIFEITETASLQSITAARSFIDSIKALGCRIALDDFGTGLSSFTYLRNFPVDILKIDGSFIRNLEHNYEDRVMVRSMVDVAHSLGKQVVAEFVATKEIYDIVVDFGIDYAQGYYISKPVSLHDYMAGNNIFEGRPSVKI